MRFKICLWFLLGLALLSIHDFRPSAVALAISPYEFSVVGWELRNLPDKWVRRAVNGPRSFLNSPEPGQQAAQVQHYFRLGKRVQAINRQLITLQAGALPTAETSRQIAELRREREDLTDTRNALRPRVEETLESAVADTLQELGFKAWTGVFPPVDTALTGSPTVLILSPRERIERIEGGLMSAGLDNDARERIEARVETETEWSALVANTGGIALYPSIVSDDTQLEYALEVIAHEWVHQWLWFRPLGRRYFESGDLTTLNETVATIAGIEIGQLARHRLEGIEPPSLAHPYRPPATGGHSAPGNPVRFDFQAEMQATRIRVDELLAAGDVNGAEAYMEARRRIFVAEGYPIRKLNQAYFAFHGAYATTGAAGVSVIGEQVLELRRRSPSLAEFLRTAAQFTGAEDLADYVKRNNP
ncbi:MAG: hypothetical protein OXI54_10955 [Chloroflexota bacterium]|nr:hypothetical protein [Chloroflexota bacterium]MDE2684649.1 hypothetical protein [Chloroflexota bacterium]